MIPANHASTSRGPVLQMRTTMRIMRSAATAMSIVTIGSAGAQAGGGAWPGFDGQPLDIQVGAVGAVMPAFEGSKSYVVRGLPFAYPTFVGDKGESKFQIKGLDDLRYRLVSVSGFEFGPLAGWRFGRQQEDAAHLVGLGDVDGGLIVGAYAAYRLGTLMPYVSYHHQVTGDDTGGIVRFGLESTHRLNAWLSLTANGGTTWASAEYMDSFFAVTALQSARSGLPVYAASSGIKDAFASLTADIRIDDRWSLKVFGQYSRLVGDAADSPITETPDQFMAGAAVAYRFSLGR